MTYKNIKFEDSPVMRSLEKLAVKKGLVKPETITKTAAPKTLSLKPTENLEENILKLCSALRSSGFESHASEVETKFFNLKRAQAYAVHNEKGEDLIDQAHPEGSHEMKGVEGNATFMTVVDRQKAIKDMVAKTPTGKLAARIEAANIIKSAGKVNKNVALNAIKIILAQESPDYSAKIKDIVTEGIAYASTIVGELDSSYQNTLRTRGISIVRQSTIEDIKENIADAYKVLASGSLDYRNIMSITKSIDEITELLINDGNSGDKTNMYFMGEGKDLFAKLKSYLFTAKTRFNAAFELLKGSVQGANYQLGLGVGVSPNKVQSAAAPASAPTQAPAAMNEVTIKAGPLTPLFGQIKTLIKKITAWKVYRSISQNAQAIKWIDDEIEALKSIDSRYGSLEEDQEGAALPSMQNELSEEIGNINEFENGWIKVKQ